MKKYILGIAMMFTMLTSCVIDEGANRTPIELGEYVATLAMSNYKHDVSTVAAHAFVADWYLSTEDVELREKIRMQYLRDRHVELVDNIVEIRRYAIDGSSYTSIAFVTDGKLLSEGGKWTRTGSYNYGITIAANSDNTYRYTINTKDNKLVVDINIAVLERDLDAGLSLGMEGCVDHYYNFETGTVSMESEIQEQVVFVVRDYECSRFMDGSIYVNCMDSKYDTTDEVMISFNGSNVCDVNYLDLWGEVKIVESWLLY